MKNWKVRWHQLVCRIWKRNKDSDTNSKNIQSGYRNGISHRKCVMLIMKSVKRQITEEIQLVNQEKITTHEEKKNYKYLGLLEADPIRQAERKNKRKAYFRRKRKLPKTKLYRRNPYQMDKHLACPLCRILGTILKINKGVTHTNVPEDKLMTMHMALQPRDYINRQCVQKRRRKRIVSIEDCVDASIQLEDYSKKGKERLIKSTSNNNDNKKLKTEMGRKQLYGYFKRQMDEISDEKTWTCLQKGNFKRETESFLIIAENSAIRTN